VKTLPPPIRRFGVLLVALPLFALQALAQTAIWSDLSQLIVAPTPNAISDVQFIGDEGWIPCAYVENAAWVSDFYHTTDGARSFEHWRLPDAIREMHMMDRLRGYGGVSQTGNIYRTEDGGRTWKRIGSLGLPLKDITCPPTGDVGFACGESGKIYKLTPTNAAPMFTGLTAHVYSIRFPESASEGWAGLMGKTLHFTTATGWFDRGNGPTLALDLFLYDNRRGWAIGGEEIFRYRGPDPEDNWVTVWFRPNSEYLWRSFNALHFSSLSEGWIVGNYSSYHGPSRDGLGLIWHTIDGGTTWTEGKPLSTTNMLTAVYAVDSRNVYVAGNNGTLFKYGILASNLPHLSISLAGTNVVLGWPAKATNFTLATTPRLGTNAAWTSVTNSPSLLGTDEVVTNAATSTSRYYRLKNEP
jgi:photosystem II stability/assembly factor-like uncharacterized protein